METLVQNTINWFHFVNHLTDDIINYLKPAKNNQSDQFREKIYDEITNCLFSIEGNLNSYSLSEIQTQFQDNLNQFFNPIYFNDPTSSNFILEGEYKFDEAEEIDSDNLRLLREDTTPYDRNDFDSKKSFLYKIRKDDNFEINDITKYIEIRFQQLKPYKKNDKILLLDTISPDLYFELIRNPFLLKTMHWRTFEKLIADVLEAHGFTIELMKGFKDKGIDIIAFGKKNDIIGSEKYIIQAKRYEENKISVETIRSLVFTHQHEKATKSILATTSTFTSDAWELSKVYEWMIELKDFNSIQKWIENAAKIKNLI